MPLALDFGDAPDATTGTGTGNYATLSIDNGPRHTIVDGLMIGTHVDGEVDAIPNSRAHGDDTNQALPDDEDGVSQTLADLSFTVGAPASVNLRVTNMTGSEAALYGWIDYDQDGVFANDSERAFVTVPDGSNNETVTLAFPAVPVFAATGQTYARFRLSTDIAAADATGVAIDGEVEDYIATVTKPTDGSADDQQTVLIAHETNGGPSAPGSIAFGTSVASLGDLDGDGVTDVAVGAMGAGPGSRDGGLFILFMNSDGTVRTSQLIANEIGGGPTILDRDNFGTAIAPVGDLDGDGVTDVAVGATGDHSDGISSGAIHILFLSSDGTVKSSQKIASGTIGAPSLANLIGFGSAVTSLGDLDGDGVPDLAVGASGDNTGANGAGAVYIVFMNADGSAKHSAQIASEINGGPALTASTQFGTSVASIGDLDADGVTELVVGVGADHTGGGYRGAVYVLFLNSDGSVKRHQKIASDVGGGPTLANADVFGSSLARLGDIDGDGVQDLAVGAYEVHDKLYILFLNADGTAKASRSLLGTPITGFGSSVTPIDDLDGDGVTDLIVGAYRDRTKGHFAGAINVVFLEPEDTTPPVALRFTRHHPLESTTNADSLVFRATFNEAVQNVQVSDFTVEGLATASVVLVDQISPRLYDVTVAGRDLADFSGGIGLSLSDSHGITDLVNLPLPTAEPAVDQLYTLVNANVDFGDAPDDVAGTGRANYNTRSADNGPRHTIVPGLFLGAAVSGEFDAVPTILANGDDVDQGSPNDEDGLVIPFLDLVVTAGVAPSVTLRATNTTANDAQLSGWIDFNQDGLFANDTERAVVTVPTGLESELVSLNLPKIPVATPPGRTYARFRLSSDVAANDPTGPASDGEVEDYVVAVTLPAVAIANAVKTMQIADSTNGGPTLDSFDRFGSSVVSLGDLNGDGVSDLAVGTPTGDAGGGRSGGVHVLFMNADGTTQDSQRIAPGSGGGPNLTGPAQFGSAVASVGDLDADGVSDRGEFFQRADGVFINGDSMSSHHRRQLGCNL